MSVIIRMYHLLFLEIGSDADEIGSRRKKRKEFIMSFRNKTFLIQWYRENVDKTACILACLHFLLGFWTDRLIFTYHLWDFSSPLMIGKSLLTWACKVVFFVTLVIGYQYLFYLFKRAPKELRRFVLLYFALLFVLLLLTYPGIWRMDEFGLLFTAQEAFFDFWQNYLTSLFYIVALMICPLPANVILLQCFVISILAGSVIYGIRQLNLVKGKAVYALFVPFLSFPVLDSDLYPMRMSVYAPLELFFLVKLVLLHIRCSRGEKLTYKDFASLFAAVPVVISLRTEAVYYFVAFPVCLFVLFSGKISRRMLVKLLCGFMALSLLAFLPQQLGSRLRNGNEYALTSVVLPIVPLVHEAQQELTELENRQPSKQEAFRDGLSAEEQRKEELSRLLSRIDQVINVDVATAGYENGKNGIALYWSEGAFKRAYTDEQFEIFQKAYHELILLYPKVFFSERLQTFLQSGDLLENTTVIFDAKGVPNHERFAALLGNQALSVRVRNTVIEILELRQLGDYTDKLSVYPIVYHVMIPLLALLGLLLFLLMKKRFGYALLLSAHLCKVPLIFLTAPSRLFMYYYPVYLVGIFAIVYVFCRLCDHGRDGFPIA